MSTRTVIISAALLLVSGAAHSQPKANTPALPPMAYTPPAPAFPTVPVPPPAPQKSVEDLLTELERVQAQKAELDKKEQELKAVISKKLEAQAERLKKLGVAPKDAKDAKEPDRVGRIIIEGNTRTPDSNILKLLNMRPGQLLRYPALEESRKNLEMVGFRSVVVEVVPDDLDSTVKDIRVKVEETKLVPAPEPVPVTRG